MQKCRLSALAVLWLGTTTTVFAANADHQEKPVIVTATRTAQTADASLASVTVRGSDQPSSLPVATLTAKPCAVGSVQLSSTRPSAIVDNVGSRAPGPAGTSSSRADENNFSCATAAVAAPASANDAATKTAEIFTRSHLSQKSAVADTRFRSEYVTEDRAAEITLLRQVLLFKLRQNAAPFARGYRRGLAGDGTQRISERASP